MKQHSSQPQKRKRSRVRTFFKWFGLVLGTLVLIGATTLAILCCYGAAYVQDVILPEVASSNVTLLASSTDLSSVVYYYDEDSGDYETLETLYASENREWISYEDIPENLLNATVAIEDKRFYQHNGVDWKRTAAAVVYMFTGQSIQGGSTITQQLIKNLTQQDEVTVRRKVVEIFEALEYEKTHTKQEILEWYLNEIYLGRGCYGVKTAAQKYFGKDVGDLDLAECAALISITNNPSLYDPYNHPENNLERRTLVLEQMYQQGYITEEERDAALAEELVFTTGSTDSDDGSSNGDYYSWYTDAVIKQVINDLVDTYGYDESTANQLVFSGGLKIYSCLDPDIQADVDEIYTDTENVAGMESSGGDQLQSAITVVDNETGAVVALAGGIGEKEGNRIWNRATDTVRQPGSSIKPLSVYSQALELGEILPNTIVEDSAFEDGWPKNSHGGYIGNVDIMYAVAQSLNTVAVKVLDMVGTRNSYNFLTEKYQLSSLVDNYVGTSGKVYSDVDYSPLALGGLTNGVSTYEMAAAYSTFSRGGEYISPYLYTAVVNSEGEVLLQTEGYSVDVDSAGNVTITGQGTGEVILSTSTCFYMTEMLEAVVSEGTGTSAAIDGMSVAGKTGTTDDDYDRWFVGYTPYYTAAVWTGYDSSSKVNASSNPAVILWQKVMSRVSSGQADIGFNEDMVSTAVTYCTNCGGIATSKSPDTRTALFLSGDEPGYTCTCGKSSSSKKDTSSDEDDEAAEEETITDTTETETETETETTTGNTSTKTENSGSSNNNESSQTESNQTTDNTTQDSQQSDNTETDEPEENEPDDDDTDEE
ncbi:MAG: PBP1A family penicillin-binding protein [Clostridiales bacterium]|nr:PBP1A family penicillin-binding protein [Clostridiales bacterium]